MRSTSSPPVTNVSTWSTGYSISRRAYASRARLSISSTISSAGLRWFASPGRRRRHLLRRRPRRRTCPSPSRPAPARRRAARGTSRARRTSRLSICSMRGVAEPLLDLVRRPSCGSAPAVRFTPEPAHRPATAGPWCPSRSGRRCVLAHELAERRGRCLSSTSTRAWSLMYSSRSSIVAQALEVVGVDR